MQQPVVKDMAALPVTAELNFVDSQKIHEPVNRHGFHRADKKPGMRRKYLFLASDQSDSIFSLNGNNAIIILPGQKTQRKTDHSGGMGKHPFNGKVGLASVGRPKHSGDPAVLENATHGKSGSAFGLNWKRWGLANGANFPHINLHQK